jgi:hypothetical protein
LAPTKPQRSEDHEEKLYGFPISSCPSRRCGKSQRESRVAAHSHDDTKKTPTKTQRSEDHQENLRHDLTLRALRFAVSLWEISSGKPRSGQFPQ